jgi:hypothetical protein
MEKTEEAVEMLNELITTKERKFGRNHFTTIKSLVDLATGLKKAGFRRKAVVLFEDVVARRQAALGKDHQLTMVGRIQLADSLFDVDNARAIELLKDVHSKRQSNSPKNWSTFNTQSLLGEAYLKHGDRELATTHLEGAYNKLESVSDEIPQVVRFTRLNDAVERLILLSKTTGDDTKLKKWTDEKKRIANDFGFVDKPNANASEGN